MIPRIFLSAMLALILSGCLYEPIHQGNRLDGNKINLIKEGDTQFTIEETLGTPALQSVLHPNRATYYEEYEDEDSGALIKRGVEVTYDGARRATAIRRFGFETKKHAKENEE